MKNILFAIMTLLTFAGQAQDAILSGTITDIGGNAMEMGNTTIRLYDNSDNLIATTMNTSFNFTGLTQGEDYKVTFENNTNALNGVSTLDLVYMMRHILGIDVIDSPYILIGLDVNGSTTLTVYDIILVRRIILAIDESFPLPSWQFLQSGLTTLPETYTLNEVEVHMASDNESIEITAIKMGDANGTAMPN